MIQFVLAVTAVVVSVSPAAGADLPTSLNLETIRSVPVQHDGRWPPLDTLARDIVSSVTGEMYFGGHDPVLLLLAWTFQDQHWAHQPLIGIANAELRGELELPADQEVFSFAELVNHQPLTAQRHALARVARGQKLDALQSKVSDLSGILSTLEGAFTGRVIRLLPDPRERLGAWHPIPRASGENAQPRDVVAAWASVGQAFVADDAAGFDVAVSGLVSALEALPSAYEPSPDRIATELHYNRLEPYNLASWAMIGGAVLATVAMFVRRTWCDVVAALGMVAGFGILSYGLWLRWQIAGRIPAANMFESLLFLSWGMGAFAIVAVFVLKNRTVPLTASGLGAVSLMIADRVIPIADHFVRPIPPVLADTVWMGIHVPVIMVSYSVLALAVLIAHVQLGVLAFAPHNRRLADTVDSLHYWYVLVGSILLLAGIITGSMWAASSWGRYWGWDPKEVWSLVAFLGYMAILHVRVDREPVRTWAYVVAAVLIVAMLALVVPKLGLNFRTAAGLAGSAAAMVFFLLARSQLATVIKSVLAFWLILMTYVGVNYVLGTGLHSYGFGKGAVARNMLVAGVIDLSVVIVLSVIAQVRGAGRGSTFAAPGVTAAPTA